MGCTITMQRGDNRGVTADRARAPFNKDEAETVIKRIKDEENRDETIERCEATCRPFRKPGRLILHPDAARASSGKVPPCAPQLIRNFYR